jgi:16S rRNA (adenine1518-N6/adenine1519-N6)-dimethyltransferase
MKVKRELEELGVDPGRGQNFLVDDSVIEALVESGEVDGASVLEIGGGTGAITSSLVDRASSVRVFETDARLADRLRERFNGDVEVEERDFLECETVTDERCVSNLPFQITSEAIEKLGRDQVHSSVIVQKELAEKAVADPGEAGYNHFSVMCQYFFVPVKLRDVPASAYYPEPEVETAILKLYPNRGRHGLEDESLFFTVSRALFTHSRKKVRNSFVDARNILEMEKPEAKELRDRLPHSERRVNSLEIREIAEVAEFYGRIQAGATEF